MQFSFGDKLISHQPPGRDQRPSLSLTNKILSFLKIAARVSILGVG